ncbi:MAG TPA: DOMON-like domain-containing protein [Sphingomonas sp.]|nr:DOMON-like domain-containing protein [Sphingomonas sp.]
MPNLSLSLHPDSRSPVTWIEVDVARIAPHLLGLTYSISGDLDHIAFPSTRMSARTDELWKHTCFEAFLAVEGGYYEFNFSPSSQWAAYRFDGHRAGMRDALADDPAIMWRLEGEAGRLSAMLRLPADVTGRLGLSAIIEDQDGNRSFWALAHPPGKPDFHHPACFAAQLPPAG